MNIRRQFTLFNSSRILLVGIFLFFAQICSAGISLTPSFLNLKMGSYKDRVSGTFEIANTGDKEERFRVKANHFVYHEDGSFTVLKPDADSMASWIKFNPKEFTLPPNSKRSVRYTVIPRIKAKDRHYWGVMELQSLTPVTQTKKMGESSYTVNFAQSILVPIYAAVGNLEYDGEIQAASLEQGDVEGQQLLSMTIANLKGGALFLQGKYELLAASGETVYSDKLAEGVILPDMKRKYVTKLNPDIEPGEYRMRVSYSAAELESPLTEELIFQR